MKKSLLALAVLGSFASLAAAQSSVTIYGKIDLAVGKANSSSDNMVADTAGSRIGFKGVEDLGNGNSAYFALEHRFSPDTGDSFNAIPGTPFWGGFSYVGLRGGWGALTVGRQYSPTFTMVQNQVDPFAGETVAQLRHIGMLGARGAMPVVYIPGTQDYGFNAVAAYGGRPLANFRVGNSVRYDAKFGGFSVAGMVAERLPNSGAYPVVDGNMPFSIAASYESGPLFIGLGYEDPSNQFDNLASLAARYNFGWANLSAGVISGKNALDQDSTGWLLGAVVPWGAMDFKVGYTEMKQGDLNYKKAGVGLHYNLSKRTKLFGDVAYVGGNVLNNGEERTGYDLGIQHNF